MTHCPGPPNRGCVARTGSSDADPVAPKACARAGEVRSPMHTAQTNVALTLEVSSRQLPGAPDVGRGLAPERVLAIDEPCSDVGCEVTERRNRRRGRTRCTEPLRASYRAQMGRRSRS